MMGGAITALFGLILPVLPLPRYFAVTSVSRLSTKATITWAR